MDAAEELWNAADLIMPMAIRVAATLRLADHIADGASSDADLARRADVHPEALRLVMAHLVRAGVFDEPVPGKYAVTDLGQGLRGEMRDWIDLEGAIGHGDLAFFGLLDAVRTGSPSYPAIYGREWWQDLDHHQTLAASFDELMQREAQAPALLDAYDWASAGKLADIGGGSGSVLAAVLGAHPHLDGILLERAGPAAMARATFERSGVSDRCSVITGSFFDPLPAGADVYLLCRVIENWGREDAIALLTRCREAAGPAGHVLIAEEGIAGARQRTGMALRQFLYVGGNDYTLSDFEEMAAAAGLVVAAVFNGEHNYVITLRSDPDGRP